MTTDTEALRRAFEAYINPDADIDLHWQSAGYYAGQGVQQGWLDFQAGYAAAKAEAAAAGEPVAWCIPNDPCNATAFAWPGTDRTPQHNVPLFTADQLAAAVAAGREKCAGIVNELRMECARRNMPESATMLWHAEDAIRAGAKEASDAA